jgi:HD-GYP domain-containing protein (c-di-GMP phosphodiesterase class II)
MTTNRGYRAAMPVADAVAELRRCSGEQFDPAVVDALLEIVTRWPAPRAARELIALAA